MDTKTIKVSKSNYKWLSRFAAGLQERKGRPISFDEALTEIKGAKTKNNSLMKLAGSWILSSEKAEKLFLQHP